LQEIRTGGTVASFDALHAVKASHSENLDKGLWGADFVLGMQTLRWLQLLYAVLPRIDPHEDLQANGNARTPPLYFFLFFGIYMCTYIDIGRKK
jgi:hypothetical protein